MVVLVRGKHNHTLASSGYSEPKIMIIYEQYLFRNIYNLVGSSLGTLDFLLLFLSLYISKNFLEGKHQGLSHWWGNDVTSPFDTY